ncbi:hypothetical protein GALMADRAFT_145308 [Galerina marginata CBS 339.88]|uniref:Uncharacterized protein n=1 Tax=Galerina marginata (strain CBS 339.88) TaxID=685588 RepID=A0A067SF82_GALM3|nr:hypothetical protein GALMADRAFT_145308 [Galerina marginata CBS 339.88]
MVQPRSSLQAPYTNEGETDSCAGYGGEESADDAAKVRELTPPANSESFITNSNSKLPSAGVGFDSDQTRSEFTGSAMRKASASRSTGPQPRRWPEKGAVLSVSDDDPAGAPPAGVGGLNSVLFLSVDINRIYSESVNSRSFAICDLRMEVEVGIAIDELWNGK